MTQKLLTGSCKRSRTATVFLDKPVLSGRARRIRVASLDLVWLEGMSEGQLLFVISWNWISKFFLLFPETKLAILLLFPGQEYFIVKKNVFLELLLWSKYGIAAVI